MHRCGRRTSDFRFFDARQQIRRKAACDHRVGGESRTSSPADEPFAMNYLGHRLVTLVLAFLILANAAGASVPKAHPSSCCHDSVSQVSLVSAPCHEDTASSALSCDDGGSKSSSEGSKCGDQCSHCAGHHASSPVGVAMFTAAGLVLRSALERTPVQQSLTPSGHRDRLERPPSVASLN
jgi:hypothetical protein